MKNKSKLLKMTTLLLVSCIMVGNMASAASYKGFPYMFNCDPNAPTNTYHISQTVEVRGGANAYAYARCTDYSSSGNKAVLTVQSVTKKYHTNSTSFTGVDDGKPMKYTDAIPPADKYVVFKGTVTKYTAFMISAQVKG